MKNLTTNENILFQVAFKEACIDARNKDIGNAEDIRNRALDLYDNVLISGLNILSERKSSTLAEHQAAIVRLKTQEEFVQYRNDNLESLSKLSSEDKEKLKTICNNHFKEAK